MASLAHEFRSLLTLSAPIVAAQMAMMGSRVADTVMAGRLSATDLAAIASGGSYWMIPGLLVIGLANGISAIVSQRRGRGDDPAAIGQFVHECLWLSLGVGVLWLALLWFTAAPVMGLLGLSDAATAAATGYLKAVSLAAPLAAVMLVFRFGADGMGDTRPFMLVGVIGLVVNVTGNYALMWGRLGAPELGAVGCGYATAIADAVMALLFVAIYIVHPRLRGLRVLGALRWPRRETLAEWWSVGAPIGVMLTFEAGFFGATGLLMARFGDVPVAAHQVAINYASVCFMVPLGIAFATTVRVGHAIGRGDTDGARLAGRTGVMAGLGFGVTSAVVMLAVPHQIVALYTDAPQVAGLAAHLLLWAAAFQVFDSLQATAAGALRGYKDTRWPMLITLVAYWMVGMPLGASLAFGAGIGPDALWWGIIAGLGTAGALLAWRLSAMGRGVLPPPDGRANQTA